MNKKYLNKITQGDCIAVLKELPAQSVDLIFADPPYNLQLQGELYRPNQTKVAAVNDQWDQFNSFKDYDDFTSAWLTACKRVLKPNGAIWVIGSYHNIFRVGKIMQDIGLWILNDIVWIKTNPMPNFKGTRFNNAQETLIWAAKNKASKYTFHYKSMKAFNDDKQMRSDWYIPICNSTERLKENGVKVHSTQKPEALLFRVISATTKAGDIVLDPFMGSGTTAAVAKKLGRQYVGIEKETRYVNAAKKRVRYIRPLELDTLDYAIEVKQPRVPFGNLIESKLVRIGDYLYSENRKYKARILANATIECSDKVGSIHKVSAQLLDKLSCNGWMFWYTQNKTGSLVLIDHLRTKYIQKYLIDYQA